LLMLLMLKVAIFNGPVPHAKTLFLPEVAIAVECSHRPG